jgi:hypothetical protein
MAGVEAARAVLAALSELDQPDTLMRSCFRALRWERLTANSHAANRNQGGHGPGDLVLWIPVREQAESVREWSRLSRSTAAAPKRHRGEDLGISDARPAHRRYLRLTQGFSVRRSARRRDVVLLHARVEFVDERL